MSKRRFVVITGPTAAGKTKVSVGVAGALGSDVISADSMQIYRSMDIGTAKATADEMDGVRHHLVDIVAPDDDYSAAEFKSAALKLIDSMNEDGRIPVITGGTGLYINALVYDLDFLGAGRNEAVRQKYTQLADDKSVQYIYNILKEKDPEYAAIISPMDKRRIIRRLEILESGSVPEYDFRRPNDEDDIIIIGLRMPRAILYERINARVDEMLEAGLASEVRRLYQRHGFVNALKGIGYKELIAYFNGEYGIDEAIRLIKRNTRRYAKRQMTWFRRDERIVWFDILNYARIEDAICDIIKYIKGKGF